jgi:hypothetical protein
MLRDDYHAIYIITLMFYYCARRRQAVLLATNTEPTRLKRYRLLLAARYRASVDRFRSRKLQVDQPQFEHPLTSKLIGVSEGTETDLGSAFKPQRHSGHHHAATG